MNDLKVCTPISGNLHFLPSRSVVKISFSHTEIYVDSEPSWDQVAISPITVEHHFTLQDQESLV